jgi:hypothetical protein
MTTIYKLTDAKGETKGGTIWTPGDAVTKPLRKAYKLCTDQVLHAYASPMLAVLMDPAHAQYLPSGKLWEGEGDIVIDNGTKFGCTAITLARTIPVPTVTLEQRVTFAIRVATLVCQEPAWLTWAKGWLDGADRSANAAYVAAYAAADAAYVAADAADAAANAADAAAYAAADAAAYAADAAANAADAAADAASFAERVREIVSQL